MEVVWIAKLHRERDLPKRYGALSGKDALELCIIRLEISLSKFKSRQTAAKQDVDGTATVHEHPLKPDAVDAGVEDERKITKFRNCHPPVYSAEGDFTVGPSREPRIRDEVVSVGDAQAGPLQ
jgi:hypothetical protein